MSGTDERDPPEDTTLERRMTDPGMFSAKGNVLWDGEAESLGVEAETEVKVSPQRTAAEETAKEYGRHFDKKPPSIDDLPGDLLDVATALLCDAIEHDEPFEDDDAFAAALGAMADDAGG